MCGEVFFFVLFIRSWYKLIGVVLLVWGYDGGGVKGGLEGVLFIELDDYV